MPSNEQAESAVESLIDCLVAAWNVHDAGRFAAVFHEDADFTNVFGMHAQGREAIERFHAPIFETMFRDSHLSAPETRVRFIRPDVAAVDVHWEMTGARDARLATRAQAHKQPLRRVAGTPPSDFSIERVECAFCRTGRFGYDGELFPEFDFEFRDELHLHQFHVVRQLNAGRDREGVYNEDALALRRQTWA